MVLLEPAGENSDVSLVAIAARDRNRAEAFAERFGIVEVVDRYQDVIDHPDVDVIYNPLVPVMHKEWTLKALRAGKPVLCEKPLAANAAEAEEMARASDEAGLLVMEAFAYRYHPLFNRAVEIVRSGAIGPVRKFRGRFLVHYTNEESFRLQYEPGGGATMELGCYPLSWARHLWGEAPEVVSARAVEGLPNVDVSMSIQLRYPSGTEGEVECSMEHSEFVSDVLVEGERGTLKATNLLMPQRGHEIELSTANGTTHETLSKSTNYSYQLEAFVEAVRNGAPVFTNAWDAVEGMRLIDASYRAAGLPLRGS